MSIKDDYEAKLAEITAIEEDQIKTPSNIPLDAFVMEAENLFKWCQKDETTLTASGLDWGIATDLLVRTGALREAESNWNVERYNRQEAVKLWAEQSPLGYQFRDELLHDFRYAYRDDRKLVNKVNESAVGERHADMIQDLNNLSVLGKQNPDPLVAISYDMTRLDQAATMAQEMSSLYSDATTGRFEYNESKKIRDQAYTYLKEAVDQVYTCGQYVFWRNEDRLAGYRSAYLRRQRMKSESSSNGNEGDSAGNASDVVDGNNAVDSSNVSDGSA